MREAGAQAPASDQVTDFAAFNIQANAQALLEVETPQRTSSNRIAAADSEYSDGQVMLTGAKLRELIGATVCSKC